MKVVFVTARYPWPARRGDQLRANQFIRTLTGATELGEGTAPAGVQIELLTPRSRSAEDESPRVNGLRLHSYRRDRRDFVSGLLRAGLGGGSLQSSFFTSRDMGAQLARLAADADVVITQLARLAPAVLALGIPLVYVDLIDALSLNFERRATLDHRVLRPLWSMEAKRLAITERKILESADRACVVCERDRRHLANRLSQSSVDKLDVVRLPTRPGPSDDVARGTSVESPAGSPTLMMTGNLGYFVNRDAVTWWLSSVWPGLRRERPDVRLVVAGSRVGRQLARLLERSGARLVRDPKDLRSLLRSATVSLAPLRAGAGVPVKILEAWAEGVPVVASTWAAAGVGGIDGEDLLVADSTDEWIAMVSALLDEPGTVARLVSRGSQRIVREHSEAACSRELVASLERARSQARSSFD